MGKVKEYIIPRKRYYERSKEDMGLTDCPFADGAWIIRIDNPQLANTYPNAKVGGLACCDCIFNRGVEYKYIKCKRKSN